VLKFFNLFRQKQKTPAIVEGEFLWCIVGNIVDKHYFGEEKRTRRGTKHFRPGAKVYCIPGSAGKAHQDICVIGQPRNSKKMIEVIIRTRHIKNFRLQKVYSPTLFDMISKQKIYRVNNSYRLSVEELERYKDYFSTLTEEIG